MGAVSVVETLPFLQVPVQIHIILVGQQLMKLLLVCTVGPVNLSVELR